MLMNYYLIMFMQVVEQMEVCLICKDLKNIFNDMFLKFEENIYNRTLTTCGRSRN